MNRNLFSHLFCAALAAQLLVPAQVAAQPSPVQGPPFSTLSVETRSVPFTALTGALSDTIKPVIDAENFALLSGQNARGVISAIPAIGPGFAGGGQTANVDQPNQFFDNVPSSIVYTVSQISVNIQGTWVPVPGTAIVQQGLQIQAFCEGWFTGHGALTYNVVAFPAAYVGGVNLSIPQLAVFVEETVPDFVNNVVTPKLASFGTGSEAGAVETGAACRTLSLQVQPNLPVPPNVPAIIFDPPLRVPPGANQPVVTVTVTRIHRLELHGVDGLPAYKAVEDPILDFFAGFTHLRFELPAMTEGQTFIPTIDNVATTLVPLETGQLVLLGVMTYRDIANVDSAFLTFSGSSGAGKQTLYTPKSVVLTHASKGGPGYEITIEVTMPPGQGLNR